MILIFYANSNIFYPNISNGLDIDELWSHQHNQSITDSTLPDFVRCIKPILRKGPQKNFMFFGLLIFPNALFIFGLLRIPFFELLVSTLSFLFWSPTQFPDCQENLPISAARTFEV